MKPFLAVFSIVASVSGVEPEFSYRNHTVLDVAQYPGNDRNQVEYKTAKQSNPLILSIRESSLSVSDIPSVRWSEEFSISTWIRVEGVPADTNSFGWGVVFFRGDDRNGLDPVYIAQRNDSIVFHLESEKSETTSFTMKIAQRIWVHLAMVFDGNAQALRIYKNGAMVESCHTTVVPMAQLDPGAHGGIGIGDNAWQPGSQYHMPFNGVVGETRIYKLALNHSEIKKLYDAGEKEFSTLTKSALPGADDILEFTEDNRDVAEQLRVTLPKIRDIISNWHSISLDEWSNKYSHMPTLDQTGTIILRDKIVIKWMVRAGGLAAITLPDGAKIYLAQSVVPGSAR